MFLGFSQIVDLKSFSHAKLSAESMTNTGSQATIESFISLTAHNLVQDLTVLFGGLLFFIPSLLLSQLNAHVFFTVLLIWPIDAIIYGVLPHAIFEIPSSIFALAGAIMLFKTELKILKGILSSKTSVKEQINESEYLIKDAIITFFIVVILLVIAGFIETFITPGLLMHYVHSL